MKDKISTATILAAGIGSRVNDFFDKPKGFLEINNTPIIEIAIEKLLALGIKKIIIIVGYKREYYDLLGEKYPEIILIYNERYATANHLYSILCLKGHINEDFLLLESDIIFEAKALTQLLDIDKRNVIVTSNVSGSGDEVFVDTENEMLMNMSKDASTLKRPESEFVGISLLSYPFFEKLCEIAESGEMTILSESYDTDGIAETSKYIGVYCLNIPDLVWGEIDTHNMYQQALNLFNH